MVRHIVLAVRSRTAGLRVYIDAEYTEVACLAGPYPVVGIASELTHRLGWSEYQSQVGIVAVDGHEVFVAFIERIHVGMERRVGLLDRIVQNLIQRVSQLRTFVLAESVQSHGLEAGSDILLSDHKAHKHLLVRQFLGLCLGIESV